MEDAERTQLRLIRDIREVFAAERLAWWLFGGWGLDAQQGRITRVHSDIEFWVERSHADPVRDAMEALGAVPLDTQPIEESREFRRGEVTVSSAFFDRNDDGTFGVLGRWSDWVFPSGSFGDSRGVLGDLEVPTMSVEGMLAMKQQYAGLRNGAPLREKDVRDINVLKSLVAAEA